MGRAVEMASAVRPMLARVCGEWPGLLPDIESNKSESTHPRSFIAF